VPIDFENTFSGVYQPTFSLSRLTIHLTAHTAAVHTQSLVRSSMIVDR